jgi:tripartite ATP-independent transporter DctM subunit
MGLLSLPIMLKYGYDKQLAAGVIVASGTLAQLIPPSLVLVVLSDQIGVGVGDLFAGALIPGLMLTAAYALYVVVVAWLRPTAAPALPPEARTLNGPELTKRVIRSVVAPGFLIFAVLGSIFFGIATPTEAGGIGALGACILAGLNGRLSINMLKEAANSTAKLTALVVNILFCSSLFSLVFDELGGKRLVTDMLVAMGTSQGVLAYMIAANIIIFVLGIFLEFTEIAFIAMPLLAPAAVALNIPLVWFGVVMAINLQTAFISPPVGFSLFYLQSVAPKEVSTLDIHKSAIPFVIIQVLVLILVIAFPETVTWLVDVFNQVR